MTAPRPWHIVSDVRGWRPVVRPWWWWLPVGRYHADAKRVLPGVWTYSVTKWDGFRPTVVARGWRVGKGRCWCAAEQIMGAG